MIYLLIRTVTRKCPSFPGRNDLSWDLWDSVSQLWLCLQTLSSCCNLANSSQYKYTGRMWIFERQMSPPPSFQSSFWHQSKQSFVNQEEFFSDLLSNHPSFCDSANTYHFNWDFHIEGVTASFSLDIKIAAVVSLLEIFTDAAQEIRCSINPDNLDPYLRPVNPGLALPRDIFICTQWFYLKLIFHGNINNQASFHS